MARPQSVSDGEILEAARRVIVRQGYDSFTLSEVAEEVGLSRAAITLRFKSAQDLKIRLTQFMVDGFIGKMAALPVERSGDGLLNLVAAVGDMLHNREGVSSFFSVHHANFADPDLLALEMKRGQAWTDVIAASMPKTAVSQDAAVRNFQAVIGGSILQWGAMKGVDAKEYLLARAQDWLTLAQIDFTKRKSRRFAAAD